MIYNFQRVLRIFLLDFRSMKKKFVLPFETKKEKNKVDEEKQNDQKQWIIFLTIFKINFSH